VLAQPASTGDAANRAPACFPAQSSYNLSLAATRASGRSLILCLVRLEPIAETQLPTPACFLETVKHSIVSFDRPFDNLGFLSEKFRKMLLYVVRS
jgi:hypothetical protein